ncbi:nucleotide-binding protein [Xanthomonas cerealis pv. cerealis]|uniref:Nucleotide-binding protein n=1 Tax=Xanthomonas cerealis pv. cerealis TaxID=152263 RepID=A0A514EDY8_9XANT|nr:nucleotide-binding protein [Xanthomonas translucens]QDI04258.1 nucleotide-binding protein [Xanthomonas translucens pv. cerealis]
MIEVVRSEEEYRALADAALDRELERAKAGLTPSVSSKAAARFLGVHVDTLGQWRRRTPPLGPAFQKGAGNNEGGANQHVRYLFVDLQEWQTARTGKTVKQRLLVDELELYKQRARELEMELEIRALREQVARMTKRAGRILALETAKECLETSHDWILLDGLVIGHVLTVPETILNQGLILGSVLHATLSDVLTLPWTNSRTRDEFSAQMNTALATLMSQLQNERSVQRARDLAARLPDLAGDCRDRF